MRLTVPQIVMLNHATQVNRARGDARYEAERELKDKREGKGKKSKSAGRQGYQTVDDGGGVAPDFDTMTSESIVSYIMSGEKF